MSRQRVSETTTVSTRDDASAPPARATSTATAQDTEPSLYECPKCFGARFFPKYSHINGGRCFTCGGAGRVTAAVVGFYLAKAGT